MSVFGHYSRYYDLLYKDKNYPEEVEFVHSLIQKHAEGAKKILELGCGTGHHAELLVKKGYNVHGIDLSEEMLQRAEQRLKDLPESLAEQLDFEKGDVRSVRLNKQFDVVISLFHVMSYQQTNQDLAAAFSTAKKHLKPGGIFLFDCWYGPGVLTDLPVVRVKRIEDEIIKVVRIAEPEIHPSENIVDVNYQIMINELETGTWTELRETHRMRYLFEQEIQNVFEKTCFDFSECGEWLTGAKTKMETWCAYCVGKNKDS